MAGSVQAAEPNWADYARLLKDYTRPGIIHGTRLVMVDYNALHANNLLTQVVEQLEKFPLTDLQTQQEKLAFYINAYNIYTLKMVVTHWPTKSIKDIGGLFSPVWTLEIGRLGGAPVNLDKIEHKILRRMGDPRIHMAINCAAVSCPDLRREPYTAAQLNAQLDDQARQFLTNPIKGLTREGGDVRVSRIFSWFAADFKASGGLEKFLLRHRPDLALDMPIVANLPYDWRVNATQLPAQ